MVAKSTEKKTSLEPSEVFCAVGLLVPSTIMRALVADQSGDLLLDWITTSGLTVAKKGIKPLDAKFEQMFKDAGSEKYLSNLKKREALVANIVAGFSAALGVKNFMKFMGDSVDKVGDIYLTGATWPQEVNDFRLQNENTGFDYNSTDTVEIGDGKNEACGKLKVLGGRIVGVEIECTGHGFTSIPEVKINSETGIGADLRPVLKFTDVSEVSETHQ